MRISLVAVSSSIAFDLNPGAQISITVSGNNETSKT